MLIVHNMILYNYQKLVQCYLLKVNKLVLINLSYCRILILTNKNQPHQFGTKKRNPTLKPLFRKLISSKSFERNMQLRLTCYPSRVWRPALVLELEFGPGSGCRPGVLVSHLGVPASPWLLHWTCRSPAPGEIKKKSVTKT